MNNLEKVMNEGYAVRCENKEEFEALKTYMHENDISFTINYPHGKDEMKATLIQVNDNVANYTLPALSMIPDDKVITYKDLQEPKQTPRYQQLMQLVDTLKQNNVLEQKFIDMFTYDTRWDDEATVSDEQFKSESGAIFDDLITKQTTANDDKKAIKELLLEKGMIDKLDHYLEQYETKGFKIVRNFIESKYAAKMEQENSNTEKVASELQVQPTENSGVEFTEVEGRKEYVQECKDTAVNSRVIGKKFIDKFEMEDKYFTTEVEDNDFKEKVQAELNRLISEEEQYKNDCNKIKTTCQQHNCDNYRKYVERYRTGTSIDDVLEGIKTDYPITEKSELVQELEEISIEENQQENNIQELEFKKSDGLVETRTLEHKVVVDIPTKQIDVIDTNCFVTELRKGIIKQADMLGIDLTKIKSGIIIEDNENSKIEEVVGNFAADSKEIVGGWAMIGDYVYKCHYDEFDGKHGDWEIKWATMIRLTAVNEMLKELGGQE